MDTRKASFCHHQPFVLATHLAVWLFVCCSNCFDLHASEKADAAPIKTYFDPSGHNVEVSKDDNGDVTLRAIGGDPYIAMRFEGHKTFDLDAYRILEFEYQSEQGVNSFQFLTRTPPGGHASSAFMKIPPAKAWTTLAIPLDEIHRTWPIKGVPYIRWEISHGKAEITLRNVVVRTKTATDQKHYQARRDKEQALVDYNTKVMRYLTSQAAVRFSKIFVGVKHVDIVIDGVSDFRGLWLLELLPSADPFEGVIGKTVPISVTDLDGVKDNSITLKRYTDVGYDSVYSKWAVARKAGDGYPLLSAAGYATRIHSKITVPEPVQASKKGLLLPESRSEFEKVAKLDLDYGTINFVANHGIFPPAEGQKRQVRPLVHMGRTLYLREAPLDRVEKTVRFCSDQGIVPIIICLFRHSNYFAHPDAVAGKYVLPDFSTREVELDLIAYMDYCAQRFMVPDDPRIPAPYWVNANEIDAHAMWANAGERHVYDYMQEYMKSTRLLYNASRKVVSYGKVFLSLTHHWTAAHGYNPGHWENEGAKSTECFPARKAVEITQRFSEREGDFEWGIGFHPYGKGKLPWAEDWDEQAKMFSFDTPYITMMNLEVLDAFMKQPRYRFRGEKLRQIHLSEQGYMTPNGKADYALQAAEHIYALKKCDRLESVVGWEPVRWTDAGRWAIGFFARHPTAKGMDVSGEAKLIAELYPRLNTADDDAATRFARDLVGVGDWDEIMYRGAIK